MSARVDAAAALHECAERLVVVADGWPRRAPVLDPARAAVDEAVAILTDAANGLLAPPAKVGGRA